MGTRIGQKGKRSSEKKAISHEQLAAKEIHRTSKLESDKSCSKATEIRYDLRILQALRRIIRAVDVQSRKIAANYGITVPQVVCLVKIVEERSISTIALSRSVYLSSSTVVGILDRLEEKGLVERHRDQLDRRIVYVKATKKGRQLVARTPTLIHETLCNAFKNLPELEQATIALSLERMIELMEAPVIDTAPILDTPVDQT